MSNSSEEPRLNETTLPSAQAKKPDRPNLLELLIFWGKAFLFLAVILLCSGIAFYATCAAAVITARDFGVKTSWDIIGPPAGAIGAAVVLCLGLFIWIKIFMGTKATAVSITAGDSPKPSMEEGESKRGKRLITTCNAKSFSLGTLFLMMFAFALLMAVLRIFMFMRIGFVLALFPALMRTFSIIKFREGRYGVVMGWDDKIRLFLSSMTVSSIVMCLSVIGVYYWLHTTNYRENRFFSPATLFNALSLSGSRWEFNSVLQSWAVALIFTLVIAFFSVRYSHWTKPPEPTPTGDAPAFDRNSWSFSLQTLVLLMISFALIVALIVNVPPLGIAVSVLVLTIIHTMMIFKKRNSGSHPNFSFFEIVRIVIASTFISVFTFVLVGVAFFVTSGLFNLVVGDLKTKESLALAWSVGLIASVTVLYLCVKHL